MPPYRILSFDGGGIAGLYTAVLLDRIRAEVPDFITTADLLAGTSTGGIIAIGLAAGLAPADLVALYRDHAKEIFDESWLRAIRDMGDLIGAKYDNVNLRALLVDQLGAGRTLAQLGKRVLVPSFRLDNGAPPPPGQVRRWSAKFFHNFPGPDSDGDQLAVDVAMRTSAAPTYFPSYQGYIDGGVVANSPSTCALVQALNPGTGNQALGDIRILSFGTGLNPNFIAGQDLDWGAAQWVRPIISVMIDGVMGVADYQCTQLLGPRFFRLDPVLPEVVKLDDTSKLDVLVTAANAVDLGETIAWLKRTY